jgi:hypothetical protein
MQPRKYIVSMIGASVIAVTSMVFAAAPPPPPLPPPLPSPTVLWVYYSLPSQGWWFLKDFDTKDECTKALSTAKTTPPQEDEGCFRLGLNPNDKHPDYSTVTPPPPPPPPPK